MGSLTREVFDRLVAPGPRLPWLREWLLGEVWTPKRYDALRCDKTFDWEVEPATLIAEPDFMVASAAYSAGVGRTTTRWAYSPGPTVECPWCK